MLNQIKEYVINILKLSFSLKKKFLDLKEFDLDTYYKEATPVFVVSPGRSGTMSIARAFLYYYDVISFHQNIPYLRFAKKIYYSSINEKAQMLKLCRGELIINTFLAKKKYIETNHYLSLFGAGLIKAFPKAKIIFIKRKKKDFIESSIKKGTVDNSFVASGKFIPDFVAQEFSKRQQKLILSKNYDLWIRKINEIKKKSKKGQFYEIKFENINLDLPEILQTLGFPEVKLKKQN